MQAPDPAGATIKLSANKKKKILRKLQQEQSSNAAYISAGQMPAEQEEKKDTQGEADGAEAKQQMSTEWYPKGKEYWGTVESSIDGVLGGYAHISGADVTGSRQFLAPFLNGKGPRALSNGYALDCGAGIGRVSKYLLAREFVRVDLVEQNAAFVESAKQLLAGESIGEYFVCGLQHFEPVPNRYDLIWIQWVVGHLTDEHLISFLQRCKAALRPKGIIVLKENLASVPDGILDTTDYSITRSEAQFLRIFAGASLTLIKDAHQRNFPKEIYPVKMFALE